MTAVKDTNWFEMPLAIIQAALALKPPKKKVPKPKYTILQVFTETFGYVVGSNGVVSLYYRMALVLILIYKVNLQLSGLLWMMIHL